MTTKRKTPARKPRANIDDIMHKARTARSTRNRAREAELARNEGMLPINVAARVVGYAPSSVHRAAQKAGMDLIRFAGRIYVRWEQVRTWAALPNLPMSAVDALAREASLSPKG